MPARSPRAGHVAWHFCSTCAITDSYSSYSSQDKFFPVQLSMSLRTSVSQRVKQSPVKRWVLFDAFHPFNGRLLRHTALRSVQGSTARNDSLSGGGFIRRKKFLDNYISATGENLIQICRMKMVMSCLLKSKYQQSLFQSQHSSNPRHCNLSRQVAHHEK
jgi:hypothetical protein